MDLSAPLNKNKHTSDSEAMLTWNDSFFDGEDDIVAVLDFDYDNMETVNKA
jgi:hypothetical protein